MPEMQNESLLARTYRLLDASNLTYREIAAGAGVGIEWLAKFKQRSIDEPGVNKVQALHDFLSARAEASAAPARKSRRSKKAA